MVSRVSKNNNRTVFPYNKSIESEKRIKEKWTKHHSFPKTNDWLKQVLITSDYNVITIIRLKNITFTLSSVSIAAIKRA